MAVRIRLKRLGAKRLHFIELLLQIPEHQEMVSLSQRLVILTYKRTKRVKSRC